MNLVRYPFQPAFAWDVGTLAASDWNSDGLMDIPTAVRARRTA